jgi:FtsZ-binding cell division protein ZapB
MTCRDVLCCAVRCCVVLQARIEELLDDKADLEYEVDVVERKVELLREEVCRHGHSFWLRVHVVT